MLIAGLVTEPSALALENHEVRGVGGGFHVLFML